MGPVWTLLLLLHIAQDVEGFCDARTNHTRCYGALGGTIEIQLMDSNSMIDRIECYKNQQKVFSWKKGKNAAEDKFVFNASTGIVHIQNLTKSDSDSYIIQFYENAKKKRHIILNLRTEAPVSSVLLQHQCLSQGEVRATCTAQGGDSPEYNWTLNGQTLTDSELLSKNSENNNITLRQNTGGQLRCSVKNHISQVFEETLISTCGYIFINCTLNGTQIAYWVYEANNTLCIEQTTATSITSVGTTPTTYTSATPTTNTSARTSTPSSLAAAWYIQYWPILAGSLVAVLITGVAIICVLRKCKEKKRNEEQDQELTYADVRILRPPTSGPQTSEGEVEYGQVKFTNQSPHISVSDDACIYAKVRR